MKTTIFITLLLLTGCVTLPPAPTAEQLEAARQANEIAMAALKANVPTCTEQRECEGMWSAARNWIATNCGMKIQTISDSFIQTYNSTDADAGCTVTKDPRPEGGYSFHAVVNCAVPCYPAPVDRLKAFQGALHAASAIFKPSAN